MLRISTSDVHAMRVRIKKEPGVDDDDEDDDENDEDDMGGEAALRLGHMCCDEKYNTMNPIVEKLAGKFDKRRDHDVVFKYHDRLRIHAHLEYLSFFSDVFKELPKEVPEGGSIPEIKIKYNYYVFHAYIQFLYTGRLSINQGMLKPLLSISHRFHDAALKQLCNDYIYDSRNYVSCRIRKRLELRYPRQAWEEVLVYATRPLNPTIRRLQPVFNVEKYADCLLSFELTASKSIWVNRAYLLMVAPSTSKLYQVLLSSTATPNSNSDQAKQEQCKHRIVITDFDYDTYNAYVRFLYSGMGPEQKSLEESTLISLWKLSHEYKEKWLEEYCEQAVRNKLRAMLNKTTTPTTTCNQVEHLMQYHEAFSSFMALHQTAKECHSGSISLYLGSWAKKFHQDRQLMTNKSPNTPMLLYLALGGFVHSARQFAKPIRESLYRELTRNHLEAKDIEMDMQHYYNCFLMVLILHKHQTASKDLILKCLNLKLEEESLYKLLPHQALYRWARKVDSWPVAYRASSGQGRYPMRIMHLLHERAVQFDSTRLQAAVRSTVGGMLRLDVYGVYYHELIRFQVAKDSTFLKSVIEDTLGDVLKAHPLEFQLATLEKLCNLAALDRRFQENVKFKCQMERCLIAQLTDPKVSPAERQHRCPTVRRLATELYMSDLLKTVLAIQPGSITQQLNILIPYHQIKVEDDDDEEQEVQWI